MDFDLAPVVSTLGTSFAVGKHSPFSGDDDSRNTLESDSIESSRENFMFFQKGFACVCCVASEAEQYEQK